MPRIQTRWATWDSGSSLTSQKSSCGDFQWASVALSSLDAPKCLWLCCCVFMANTLTAKHVPHTCIRAHTHIYIHKNLNLAGATRGYIWQALLDKWVVLFILQWTVLACLTGVYCILNNNKNNSTSFFSHSLLTLIRKNNERKEKGGGGGDHASLSVYWERMRS